MKMNISALHTALAKAGRTLASLAAVMAMAVLFCTPVHAAGYVGLSQQTMICIPGYTYTVIATGSGQMNVVDNGISAGTQAFLQPINGGYQMVFVIGADEPVNHTIAFLVTSTDPAGGFPGSSALYVTVKAKGDTTGLKVGNTTVPTSQTAQWSKPLPYGYEYITGRNNATEIAAILDAGHTQGVVYFQGKRVGTFVTADATGQLYPMYLTTQVPYLTGTYIGLNVANPLGQTLYANVTPTDKAVLIANGFSGLCINGQIYDWQ